MKKAKIFFTWHKNNNCSIDFQGGLFKTTHLGRFEFYIIPSLIFYKWMIPKLGDDFDYETRFCGLRIFLLGEYYIELEFVTRIFAKNGA